MQISLPSLLWASARDSVVPRVSLHIWATPVHSSSIFTTASSASMHALHRYISKNIPNKCPMWGTANQDKSLRNGSTGCLATITFNLLNKRKLD
ncbi:hypothetical protein evm_000822 [Chilo suppressalis]|nr:hypothetical protein evm_000822 [Chilo suppressalis]